jgi:hypothetical protein
MPVKAQCWVCQKTFAWSTDTPMLCPKCLTEYFRPAFAERSADKPDVPATIPYVPIEQKRRIV